jgi:hypothetical protein
MAAPTKATGQFDAGAPQALFSTGAPSNRRFFQTYTVTKDGQRFVFITKPQQSSVAPLTVVVNWPATIQK